ncbi:RNA methyltransferase [Paenibacillus tyrfis]|uniref:RNA methyltransferase n=1 Tax=Paenibacillus tyrfis TaxID=1501230 RepID=A0A081NU82_9BACL|nr:RNA methyltransferase [Paenibacillus tyrfis]
MNGFTLFIQGALPGEKVRAKVLKVKKQYGYAKLLEIIEASPDRIDAPCPIYKQCGGCQLQHLSYDAQLRWKRQLVIDNLERIGKLRVAGAKAESDVAEMEAVAEAGVGAGSGGARDTGIVVHPTLGMSAPWRYRNKAQVPIGLAGGKEGGLIGGFYAQGSHRIIDMEACLIQHENNDAVVAAVKRIAVELGIRPYNEETGKGLLRHVIARYGFNTGEIMVVLVTNGRDIPHRDELVGLIREAIPDMRSICQNVNRQQTNVIFGDETRVLWGSEVIYDTIGDIRFAISARSFYQVNPVQTEVLYRKALDYAGLSGEETVIDAYCGIGTISLFLAQKAREVYGVEIVPEAIEDAKRNALVNEIRNVRFEVGGAEVVIPEWKRQGITPDVIVVDPPRKGCDAALLETILAMRPERVVYVSCNPSTLARDLRVLEDGGYRTMEVQPVDMFPHTVHVESVALLVRNGPDY